MVRATSLVRSAVAARTCAQSTPRNASATSCASRSSASSPPRLARRCSIDLRNVGLGRGTEQLLECLELLFRRRPDGLRRASRHPRDRRHAAPSRCRDDSFGLDAPLGGSWQLAQHGAQDCRCPLRPFPHSTCALPTAYSACSQASVNCRASSMVTAAEPTANVVTDDGLRRDLDDLQALRRPSDDRSPVSLDSPRRRTQHDSDRVLWHGRRRQAEAP